MTGDQTSVRSGDQARRAEGIEVEIAPPSFLGNPFRGERPAAAIGIVLEPEPIGEGPSGDALVLPQDAP